MACREPGWTRATTSRATPSTTLLGTPPTDADGLEVLPADQRAAAAAALDGNGMVGFDQLADAAAHATWY